MPESTWRNRELWTFYLETYEVDRPTVLPLGNFKCHVSEEGQRLVAEQANATVVPLPPSSTPVCQALDVGVMGPLNA
ncbi:hypothetical protein ON010_g14235 [Phytophthora cinnamomi]|nr:hypothetical protein ON010_g14235 [Phytophthora cinnamomi]